MAVVKLPLRWCTATKANGHPCEARALAFIGDPVLCSAHAPAEIKVVNAELRALWTDQQIGYEEVDPPDDIIIAPSRPGFIKTIHGYRPDAIKAFSKIAGAKYIRTGEERYWEFPEHRLAKVQAVAKRYFSEIVYEGRLA